MNVEELTQRLERLSTGAPKLPDKELPADLHYAVHEVLKHTRQGCPEPVAEREEVTRELAKHGWTWEDASNYVLSFYRVPGKRARTPAPPGPVVHPPAHWGGAAADKRGIDLLRDVKAARAGDSRAHGNLEQKGWVVGVDASGGYLVQPEQLQGYIEARTAAAPLRARCTEFAVESNEVWVVIEGDTVTVSHVAEAATKPDSTGTVAQKVSTIHKAAGTSHISDELLEDTQGLAADLVSRQFAQQVGMTLDRAIISGTGTGQPTGIRNTAGVASTAVDGQGGQALNNSILKAMARLRGRFYEPDTIVVAPRDLVKFDLAVDAQQRYLFEGGLSGQFPGTVPDANIPTNLGAGTNESIIIVGAFRPGAYFFRRTALTIEASRDAGWTTDETVFRAVERYGFAVIVPGAFEILTGITP